MVWTLMITNLKKLWNNFKIIKTMDKSQLYDIVEIMKLQMSSDQILDALCMSLDSDTLEEHLRYIDRNYETNCFED